MMYLASYDLNICMVVVGCMIDNNGYSKNLQLFDIDCGDGLRCLID